MMKTITLVFTRPLALVRGRDGQFLDSLVKVGLGMISVVVLGPRVVALVPRMRQRMFCLLAR